MWATCFWKQGCGAGNARTFPRISPSYPRDSPRRREALFEHLHGTRAIRRGIVETGRNSAAPRFRPATRNGRSPNRHCGLDRQSIFSQRAMDTRVSPRNDDFARRLGFNFSNSTKIILHVPIPAAGCARVFCERCLLENQRAYVTPGARCTRSLVCENKTTQSKFTADTPVRPAFRTNGFNVYSCSPG